METEYVLRFSTTTGPPPPKESLYLSLEQALRARLTTAPAGSGRFMANGGAFSFEPSGDGEGGLLEMATPECAGPAQLLLYQKAQEALLWEVLPAAQVRLEEMGYRGELGLLKNCRDAMGQTYGVQENYELILARGWRLWVLRLFIIPVTLVCALPSLVLNTISTLLGTLWNLVGGKGDRGFALRRWLASFLEPQIYRPLGLFFDITAFHRVRRLSAAFLVSRTVVIGAGTLEPDGRFLLSERAPSLDSLTPRYRPQNRSLFRTTNLVTQALRELRPKRLGRMLGNRGRLQLGCSEANLCPKAEYLKLATTCLVFDMIESGFLKEAPRLLDPLGAAEEIGADLSLGKSYSIVGGQKASALELQRWYLDQAQRFLESRKTGSLEGRQVLKLWSQTLDQLEQDPSRLFGTLDWVTKRVLLAEAAAEPIAVRKKIDIRYHELGSGYFAVLERAGAVEGLVESHDLERAKESPPEGTPALARAQAIGQLAEQGAVFSWEQVETGEFWCRKVVPFPRD